MCTLPSKKHQFVQKCIDSVTDHQKLHVLTKQQYVDLMTEVEDAYKAMRKTTKQRRRIAQYELFDDVGRERLIKKGSSEQPVFVLTVDEVFETLQAAHSSTGHGGRDRMMAVSNRYQNITRTMVEIYLSLCLLCHEKKSLPLKGIVTKPIVMDHYMEKMQIDLIDMQSKPDGEFKWILVCEDHFTKRISLRPLRSKRGDEVAHGLIDVFSETGAPERLQHDCGREFRNQHVKTLPFLFPGMVIERGRPRHPESQGLVERANQDIQKMLYCWMRENKTAAWVFGKFCGCKMITFKKNIHFLVCAITYLNFLNF